jgi:bifunctional ADP-heptose synthase (sugar kinase/adenylyltransferase)
VATEPIRRLLAAEAARGKVVAADSRQQVRAFRGVTLVTPNETELLAAHGIQHLPVEGAGERMVRETGQRLLEELGARAVIVTRGNRGMILFEPGQAPRMVPIAGTTEIVDVSGAGDTVVSAAALALASGAGLLDAARIATIAAGAKVMKLGAVPVTADEVRTGCRGCASSRKSGREG